MDAVLMCAGLGTRLRPHTQTTPKPLLPVQGKPILEWILTALPVSVDRVLVVTHYLAEQFDEYLSKQTIIKEWITVPQGEPRGTGDALRRCQSLLHSDTFLVLNGDDLFGAADLAQLASYDAGLIVHEVADPRKFGIAFFKPNQMLEKLVEKPDLDGPQPANTGAYVFPRDVFNIELKRSPRGEFEITDYVSTLAAQRDFHVVRSTFWYPIGNVEAWQSAQSTNLAPCSGSR